MEQNKYRVKCICSTKTLTSGKVYPVTPLRRVNDGWGFQYIEGHITKRNVIAVRVKNNYGNKVIVRADRFNLSSIWN